MNRLRMVVLPAALIVAFGAAPAFAQLADPGEPSSQARAAIAAAVDEAVAGIVPGPILQTAKATYLEGYGVVVTLEVALERPRNPFSSPRTPSEIQRSSEMRRSQLKEMAVELLRQHVSDFEGLPDDERLTIVIYMLNTNPADLPDLPAQLVVSARKQDGGNSGGPPASASAFAQRVTIREY